MDPVREQFARGQRRAAVWESAGNRVFDRATVSRRKTVSPDREAPSKVLLVRGARQLLTLRGGSGPRRGEQMRALGVIPDGALLIVDGVIREVGPSRRVEMLAAAREAEELDASGRVVMPGFADCQTHLLAPPAPLDDYETRCLQGRYPEPLLPGGWTAFEAAKIMRGYSAQRLELEGKRQLRSMWRHGTLALGSTSGAGLDEASELRALRVLESLNDRPVRIVPSFGGGLGLAPEFDGRAADYLEWVREEILPLLAKRKLAGRVDVALAGAAFSRSDVEGYAAAARRAGLGIAVRLRGPVSWLPEGTLSVSGVRHLERGAARLADNGTVAVFTPGAHFHSGEAEPEPAREFIAAGAAVAVSTAFHPRESPTPSMPMAIALACAQLRMTPAEAITAATINGACALGIGAHTGSLEAGKTADLLVMNAADYREIPMHFGINPVMMALRRGQVIFPRLEPA